MLMHFGFRHNVIAGLLFSAMLSACASTRHISAPSAPPPELNLAAATSDIELKLHYVIVPDGPGSWVQGAKWNEWVVSFKNAAKQDVTIDRISLIDPRGVYLDSSYSTLESLESQSEQLAKTYQNVGLLMSSGPLIGQGVAQLAMATGSVLPVYLATPLIMGLWNAAPYMEAKDREAVSGDFGKRQLRFPIRLSSDGVLRGSAFFPLIPEPRALVVSYSTSKGKNHVSIQLPKEIAPTLMKGAEPAP